MELDRTEIVIRSRSSLELLDLSLLVVKRHAVMLSIAGALFGLPLLLLDIFLLHWTISEDAILAAEDVTFPEFSIWFNYVAHFCILWCLQLPLATFPVTVFLGAQIFYLPISVSDLLGHLRGLAWRAVWVLGIFRMGIIGFVVLAIIYGTYSMTFWEGIYLFVLFPIAMIVRMMWPFAPEIIGLERCPLRSKDKNEISYSKRRSSLHGPLQGELFGRMLVALFFGTLLLLMLVGTALFVKAIVTGSWQWNWYFYVLVLPAALWLVGIFLAIFRYLSYIDSRIRLEGWEIELRLRAEALRMERVDQPHINTGSSTLELGGA